jgi:peroxiredoxin
MALTVAERLSKISLPNVDGLQVRLSTLWAATPAVVVFLRHYGWIFSRQHVAQLRAHEHEFRAAGARLVAIGLGDQIYAWSFRQATGIGFPLLVDETREAYQAAGLRTASILHLLRRDNFVARRRARAAGHPRYRPGQNPFQLGGSFVFGPGNVDRFAHVSQTFCDNAAPADLLAAVRRR